MASLAAFRRPLALHDLHPAPASFRDDVVAGLRRAPKSLPCKYFYDARGSALFDRICALDSYYPTRTELAIMRAHVADIAGRLGRGCRLVEYGSGSSLKTRVLLDHLPALAGYVPIDISREHLMSAAADLAAAYPGLDIQPVCADYTGPLDLPAPRRPVARQVVYYPGSTIGNFHPPDAEAFLARMADVAGPGGGLLIGVDLKKDVAVLEHAYNEPDGVTAAFNLNLLGRINRELGGDFDLTQFRHHAPYDAEAGRIEMRLISLRPQVVRVAGEAFAFAAGEPIVTEHSYKYGLAEFEALAWRAGWSLEAVWTDTRRWFSVQWLQAR